MTSRLLLRTAALALAIGAVTLIPAHGAGAAAPSPGAATPTSIPACALGTNAFGLTPYYGSQIDAATLSYGQTLSADAPATRAAAERAFAAAAAAYVYGMPQELLRTTVKGYVRNEIVNVNALATPSTQGVVSPNVDTAYTVAWIDLTDGPVVVNVPDTHGRYYMFQFMDAYTNAFGYVGSGSTGTGAGAYAIVPPGYTGALPAGVTAIRSPTNTVWLLGRTLVDGAADFPAVKQIQDQYALTPLAAWEAGVREPPVTIGSYPSGKTKTLPSGTAFISALNQDLTIDPPPAADDCALEALAPAGVVLPHPSAAQSDAADAADIAGLAPSWSGDAATAAAVSAGVAAGARIVTAAGGQLEGIVSAGNHGWAILNRSIGTYGTDFLSRAFVGRNYLGANTPAQGMYPAAYVDVAGRALNGASAYTITFPKGLLPPARAFWSLTMYGSDNYLYANQIDRYAIRDRTPGLVYGKDGSLTLYLQHAVPGTAAARANWLPAPSGAFHVILRLYEPTQAALDESWRPPPIFGPGEILRPALTRLRVRGAKRIAITYRDSQAATTRLTIVNRRTGRVVKRLRHRDRAGANRVTIRLGKAGRYRLRAVAAGSPASYDNAPSTTVFRNFRAR